MTAPETAAGAGPDSAAQRELLEVAEEWARAIVSNDAESIGQFMSEDWTIVSQTGATDKRTFLSWIESGDVTHEAMAMVERARVQVYGDMAVLVARVTNNGHYRGQPFSADEWTTDVFLKREGRWVCVLSHITSVGGG